MCPAELLDGRTWLCKKVSVDQDFSLLSHSNAVNAVYNAVRVFDHDPSLVQNLVDNVTFSMDFDDGLMLRAAVWYNKVALVRRLLTEHDADPRVRSNHCLFSAAHFGRTQLARALLDDQRTDPSDVKNKALRAAREHKHSEIATMIESDSRYDPHRGEDK